MNLKLTSEVPPEFESQHGGMHVTIINLRCIVSIVIMLRFSLFFVLSIRNKLEFWRIIPSSTP